VVVLALATSGVVGDESRKDYSHAAFIAVTSPLFRFTIRDLLWLMVVVALALSWWIDRSSLASAKNEAIVDARSLTWFLDPAIAGNSHFAPLKRMLSRKYPHETAPQSGQPTNVALPQPK
jgi:hypothetical protein